MVAEGARTIDAFGGKVTILASGEGASDAVGKATKIIAAIHTALTRFDPESELCRLNANAASTVTASPIMLRFLEAVRFAGDLSGGLVDATCIDAVERAGYTHSLVGPTESSTGLVDSPPANDADRYETGSWKDVEVDLLAGTVTRPPGLRFDAGGLGKGMAADMAAERLCHLDSFAVECLGEVRLGGTNIGPRQVQVAAPDRDSGPVASLSLQQGAVATSGITRRAWMKRDGKPSHHLIDPRTGEPVESGLIQATAIAPTALEAEVRAKQAVISGPDQAMKLLPEGGVIVLDDHEVVFAPPFKGTGTHR